MSLEIDIQEVEEILLMGGWYTIEKGSFSVGAYEFVSWDEATREDKVHELGGVATRLADNPLILLRSGEVRGVPSMGFECRFAGEQTYTCGPLTSILALKFSETPQ
tara:strand:- start:98 stop:415 length:318 start_codon:yes stop_codon:yes gene_type:complete